MNIEVKQVLTQLVAFLIMLWVLKRYAWGPLFAIIDERKRRVEAEFSAIDEQKRESAKLDAAYRQKLLDLDLEAKGKIEEAVLQSRKIVEEASLETKAETKAMIAEAKEEITRQMTQAKMQLNNEIVNMAIAMTKKVALEGLNEEQQQKLISNALEKGHLK